MAVKTSVSQVFDPIVKRLLRERMSMDRMIIFCKQCSEVAIIYRYCLKTLTIAKMLWLILCVCAVMYVDLNVNVVDVVLALFQVFFPPHMHNKLIALIEYTCSYSFKGVIVPRVQPSILSHSFHPEFGLSL